MKKTWKTLFVRKIWLVTRLNTPQMNFKKIRYEKQYCKDFQPCRKFLAEQLAVHLIIVIKTVKLVNLRLSLIFTNLIR